MDTTLQVGVFFLFRDKSYNAYMNAWLKAFQNFTEPSFFKLLVLIYSNAYKETYSLGALFSVQRSAAV